jgi:hypothetical protein
VANSREVEDQKTTKPDNTKDSYMLSYKYPVDFFLRNENSALYHLGVHRDTVTDQQIEKNNADKLDFFRSTNSTMKQPNFDRRASYTLKRKTY